MTKEKGVGHSLYKWPLFIILMGMVFATVAQEKPKSLVLDPGSEVYVLRCFSKFNDKVKSHSIAVGDPTGIHYLIDSNTGSLLQIWKGEFVDVAPMWINRGGGFFKTSASTKLISDVAPFAILKDEKEQWPDSASVAKNLKFKGYHLDKSGKPTFKYLVNTLTVDDKIQPSDDKKGIIREVQVSAEGSLSGFYVLLAEGSDIKKTGKNSYSVSGKNYSVVISESGKNKPILRTSNGRKELLVLIEGDKQTAFKYTITL